jgi:hypothetical protein
MSPRHLHRWWPGLTAALALVLAPPVPLAAEQARPAKVHFTTVDGVKLKGFFYPSDKKAEAPCVILVHDVAGSCQQKGWDSLALKLQARGNAVLRFDLRGHGDSKEVDKEFWLHPVNRQGVKGWRPNKAPESINFKDFQPTYLPNLVNDLAAAKAFFDRKNDEGACNSANTVLVGEKAGAALAALFLKSECCRHRFTAQFGQPASIEKDSEAKDYLCAIWLSFSPTIGRVQVTPKTLLWLPGHEKKMPMAFVYGAKDDAGKRLAESTVKTLKKDIKNLDLTDTKPIKDGAKLKGRELLQSSLETEAFIVKYLEAVVDKKSLNSHDTKETKKNGYIWLFSPTVRVVAKKPGDKEAGVMIPTAVLLRGY